VSSARNPTYYGGDLRRDLLDAALRSVLEVGAAHVSLRGLAREVGVSHAAPKNHFADRRALFTALAAEAHRHLSARIGSELAQAGPAPLDRVLAAGRGYLGFTRDHPAHFAVMWREDLVDPADPALTAAVQTTQEQLADVASAVLPHGPVPDADPQQFALLAWSLVHGLADLGAAGALDDLPGAADPGARDEGVLALFAALLARRDAG
jgi:AcrR family transcriptional regulator